MTLSDAERAQIARQADALLPTQRRDRDGTDGSRDRPLSYIDLLARLRQRVNGQ